MKYRIGANGELNIYSTNCSLDNRWTVVSPAKMEEICNGRWTWFNNIINRRDERTNITLGYDDNIGKPVIVKTINYRSSDLSDEEAVRKRRSILVEQINILNDISSPLLPEPLDWFFVKNGYDKPMGDDDRMREPVLILDYIPATSLTMEVRRNGFKYKKDNSSVNIKVDTSKVAGLGLSILYFLKLLKEKDYAYLALSLDHILLLRDYVPRFVGLGRICRIKNGHLDSSHINFGRTLLGYSAPELNDSASKWGEDATSEEVGAFSLGAVLHQIIIESTSFDERIIKNGSLLYPNGITDNIIKSQRNGRELHRLISMLCNHNPNERLTDYDYIEEILKTIELNGGVQYRNKNGIIKYYDSETGNGIVTDINGTEYKFYRNAVERNVLNKIESGLSVIFSRTEYDDLITVSEIRDTISTTTFKKITPIDDDEIINTNYKPQQSNYPKKPQKDGWCFISTAAYGSYTAPKLDLLRWYRDNVLIRNKIGRRSLDMYFKYSPKISHKLRGMKLRKRLVRSIINIEAFLIKKIQNLNNRSILFSLLSGLIFIIYLFVFLLSYILVIPERMLNIETTDSKGEYE